MQIEIKQALLEGHTPEVIVEAVHANHPHLDKKLLKNPNTSYLEGKQIEQNRKSLVDSIRKDRYSRDIARKVEISFPENSQTNKVSRNIANSNDNSARASSQKGKISAIALNSKELLNIKPEKQIIVLNNVPRIVSSAKQ